MLFTVQGKVPGCERKEGGAKRVRGELFMPDGMGGQTLCWLLQKTNLAEILPQYSKQMSEAFPGSRSD